MNRDGFETTQALLTWAQSAEPGDEFIYGYSAPHLMNQNRAKRKVASVAYSLMERGIVRLAQRKTNNPANFDYIAIMRG